MNKNFWKNKKVFITGHTGFKGSWLTLILSSLGAKIVGYSLDPISKPNFFDDLNLSKFLIKDYRNNILNLTQLKTAIKKTKPTIVFHMAAQSSVLVSYSEPTSTIATNVIGTTNFLESIKNIKSIKSAIIVTTDKVYLNLEKKIKFKEDGKLGGHDIYSSSKAACEILTESYIKSFFSKSNCNIATVRSGNCIGGGDWTKDRIIKDCVESFIKNKNLIIRSPNSTRPWQHVLEPLFGYLKLAKKLFHEKKYATPGSWNFGPNKKNNLSVKKLAMIGKKILRSKSNIITVKKKFYESENLSLDSSKSLKYLKWRTKMSAKESLEMTFIWFKYFYKNIKKDKKKIVNFTLNQIEYFKKLDSNL